MYETTVVWNQSSHKIRAVICTHCVTKCLHTSTEGTRQYSQIDWMRVGRVDTLSNYFTMDNGRTVFILFKSKVGEVHFSSEQINASTIKWVTVFWLTMQYQSDCLTDSIQNNRLKFDISSQFPPMCNDLFAEASAHCSSLLSQVAPPSNTYWSSNSRYKLVSSLHFHQRSKKYFSWFMTQRQPPPSGKVKSY